jgi:hypothetical protein
MPLSLPEVSRFTRTLVSSHFADRVQVGAVAHTAPASDYAEVLLTVLPHGPTDRRGPRTVLVQVRRHDVATLEVDLRQRLARALRGRPVGDEEAVTRVSEAP